MALLSNLSSTTKMVLSIVAAIVLMIVGFAGYVYWDASTNYVPARARVTSVVDNCSLERRRSSGSRRRHEIGPMDCAEARLKRSQGYSRYSLKQHRHVAYTYTSPVDGRSYPGSNSASPSDYPHVREGSEIDILAHEREPGTSRRPL